MESAPLLEEDEEDELPVESPVVAPAPVAEPEPLPSWEPLPAPEPQKPVLPASAWEPIAPAAAPEPRFARQSEFNLDMGLGSAEDASPADSMDRVADMFGDDDDLARMVASRPQSGSRTARNINVFPKKSDTAAEEELAARVSSMFDDEAEEDEFKPQLPPRSIPRRSGLGYNDMSDIFPNG